MESWLLFCMNEWGRSTCSFHKRHPQNYQQICWPVFRVHRSTETHCLYTTLSTRLSSIPLVDACCVVRYQDMMCMSLGNILVEVDCRWFVPYSNRMLQVGLMLSLAVKVAIFPPTPSWAQHFDEWYTQNMYHWLQLKYVSDKHQHQHQRI